MRKLLCKLFGKAEQKHGKWLNDDAELQEFFYQQGIVL